MTRDELKRHFPEAIVPKDRAESIPSDITSSPLYKQAGSESKAVDAFASKLVEFAKENQDTPEFKAGRKWYSEFVPRLKKEFGKDAQTMAELLAATSPQTNVETNFAYALDALESLKAGRFDKIISKFEQGLEMIEDNTWLAWYNRHAKDVPNAPAEPTPAAFLAHWIETHNLKPRQSNGKLYGQHSLPVLQVFARRWLSDARGPKTLNFVQNLLGTGHEATIDLWADDAATWLRGFGRTLAHSPAEHCGCQRGRFYVRPKGVSPCRRADEDETRRPTGCALVRREATVGQ
jgi:hypothetical protein